MISCDSSDITRNSCVDDAKTARTDKHSNPESGNAALWIIIVVAALVIVALAMLMGRGKEHSQDNGSPPPKQAQERVKQDERPREHVRVQKPADPQRRPDRARRPPPGVRRPGDGPPVPPHDPRERQRALQSRHDSKRPAPGKGGIGGDQQDAAPGFDDGAHEQDDDGLEADVAGSPEQASPS